jgi:hypothetical protein
MECDPDMENALMRRMCVLVLTATMASWMTTVARAQTANADPKPDASTATPAQAPAPDAKKPEPFAFADFTWLTGNPRTKESAIDTKVFTGEIRFDTAYTYSFNRPQDDTIGGSSEVFRHGEVQVTQIGVGGDFHHENVRGRLMT